MVVGGGGGGGEGFQTTYSHCSTLLFKFKLVNLCKKKAVMTLNKLSVKSSLHLFSVLGFKRGGGGQQAGHCL